MQNRQDGFRLCKKKRSGDSPDRSDWFYGNGSFLLGLLAVLFAFEHGVHVVGRHALDDIDVRDAATARYLTGYVVHEALLLAADADHEHVVHVGLLEKPHDRADRVRVVPGFVELFLAGAFFVLVFVVGILARIIFGVFVVGILVFVVGILTGIIFGVFVRIVIVVFIKVFVSDLDLFPGVVIRTVISCFLPAVGVIAGILVRGLLGVRLFGILGLGLLGFLLTVLLALRGLFAGGVALRGCAFGGLRCLFLLALPLLVLL
jgi:hypothetical protein